MVNSRVLRAGGAAFIAVGLLGSAGCMTRNMIKPDAAAQWITEQVSDQTGFTPDDVTCPDGIEAKADTEFDCTFTGPEGQYKAHMKILKVEGEQAFFDMHTVAPNE